jgi:hypothetical protein
MAGNRNHPLDAVDQPGQLPVALAQRTKTILESELLRLIQQWEAETGCVVRNVDLTHSLAMGQSCKTYSVLVTAEL